MKRAPFYLGLALFTVFLCGRLTAQGVVTISLSPPPNCAPPQGGLISWWPAEGNGTDIVSGFNAPIPPSGITFEPGVVGLGFAFDGSDAEMNVPNEPALNFGPHQDFSIETWILAEDSPSNSPADELCIVDKRTAASAFNYYGYHLYLSQGQLFFQMADTSTPLGGLIVQAGPDLRDGSFHHVAVTVQRDLTNGGALYVDGTNVLTFDPTGFTGSLSNDNFFCIGNNEAPGYVTPFHGIIDELSVYNQALTPTAISAIYRFGSVGKCSQSLTPTILSQPVGFNALEGSSAALTVAATGPGPIQYQWLFFGGIIPGATNATLAFNDILTDQAGNYSVRVSNAGGTTLSSNATITVTDLNILEYDYSGSDQVITKGSEFSYKFSGTMFFLPATTNGTFVGWANIHNKKQYWVSPFSDYRVLKIAGSGNHIYTVFGKAGLNVDDGDFTHIWSYVHTGLNETLTISKHGKFSFPKTMEGDDLHIYPNTQTSDMIMDQSSSKYTYSQKDTESANDNGQTMQDLVNALTAKLRAEGYKPQP